MKNTKSLLLAGILALGSIGFTSAKEGLETPKAKVETTYRYSPIIVSKGKITLETTDLDGKVTTEVIDLAGKDLVEVKQLLGRKQGEANAKVYGNKKRNKGKNRGGYYRGR